MTNKKQSVNICVSICTLSKMEVKMIEHKIFICLCQGLSKTGKISPQTQEVFLKMTELSPAQKPGFVVISGGYKHKNGATEAASVIDFMSQNRNLYPSIKNIERTNLSVESSSTMKKGGNISNLKEVKAHIKGIILNLDKTTHAYPNLMKHMDYRVVIFTSKLTTYRTTLVANKIFSKENVSVVGVEVPFGGNIQTRYSSRTNFILWNWMLNIATFLLLPFI